MKNLERQSKLSEWQARGAEWCASQLWSVKQQLKTAQDNYRREQKYRMQLMSENDAGYRSVLRSNENMAKVLNDFGIKPMHLRVTYRTRECERCDYNSTIDCYYEDGDRCPEEKIKVAGRISFYSYEIDGCWLEGITSAFNEEEYEVVKVCDLDHGDIIYERQLDKEEN